MISGQLKLPEKDVRIAQVAVGPALRRLVAELPRDPQTLLMVLDGGAEVAEQVISVAEVAARSALRRAVADLAHQRQVLLVVVDGLHERVLDLVRVIVRPFLLPQLLSLGVVHVAEVVQRSAFAEAVAELSGNGQVPFAAQRGLVEAAHDFESISEVSRRFG